MVGTASVVRTTTVKRVIGKERHKKSRLRGDSVDPWKSAVVHQDKEIKQLFTPQGGGTPKGGCIAWHEEQEPPKKVGKPRKHTTPCQQRELELQTAKIPLSPPTEPTNTKNRGHRTTTLLPEPGAKRQTPEPTGGETTKGKQTTTDTDMVTSDKRAAEPGVEYHTAKR